MILLWLLAFDTQASIDTTLGSSQSKQETHSKGTEAVSSNVAGKEVNIITTGAGTDSNIHVQGSNISGTDATRLIADNNVILESAQNTSEEHSSNKSSGWNAGVVVGTQGIGITAGGNVGKGKGEGTGVAQVNTHVGSSTGNTFISAGGDTTLAGAQVLGKGVELDTNNLVIESRQDTSKYDSKQTDASAQATLGYGVSVSGSFSNSKTNADYASVNEQSGILAGDDGYNINVKNHTDLKGGIITSTQAAEDAGRNSFSTSTLTASDIQNHADYSASGFGLSGGFGINGSGNKGNWAPQGSTKTSTTAEGQTVTVTPEGKDGLTVNKSIGYGSDSGHDSSVTTSGINTSNITLTDAAGQNASGISVEQIKEQIKTDTTTDTVQANSGAIANNFDKDAVQKEIGLQVAVTQQFDITRQGVKAEINQQVDKQQQAVKEAKAALELNPYDQAAAQKLNEANTAIQNWQQGGVLVDMIAGGLSGPTSTGAAGTIANAAAPALQYAVGQYFKGQQAEGSTAHIVAHTVLAAAVAAAGGNDALTAGLSAGGAELLAPKVANWLFGNTAGIEKDENGNVIASKLTAEQKQTVSNIVSLGAAGLTAGAGGTGTDMVSSSQLASSAVEDNYYVANHQVSSVVNQIHNQCGGLGGDALRACRNKIWEERVVKSDGSNRAILNRCLEEKDDTCLNAIRKELPTEKDIQQLSAAFGYDQARYNFLIAELSDARRRLDACYGLSFKVCSVVVETGTAVNFGAYGAAGGIGRPTVSQTPTPKTGVHNTETLSAAEVRAILNNTTVRYSAGKRNISDEFALLKTYDKLTSGGVPTYWKGYEGRVVRLNDGTEIGLRFESSSGLGKTLDIRYPNGKLDKIHIKGK